MTNASTGRTDNKNNRGQIAIESLLLMTILIGLFLLVTKKFQEEKLLSKLVAGPIRNVAAMAAYGTWKADGCTSSGRSRQTIGKCHPNSSARNLTSAPRGN